MEMEMKKKKKGHKWASS